MTGNENVAAVWDAYAKIIELVPLVLKQNDFLTLQHPALFSATYSKAGGKKSPFRQYR
jgi:hypothetical protein